MPRFSSAFRSAMQAGHRPVPFATVAWASGTRHYGPSPRSIGGYALDPRLIGGDSVSSAMPTKPGSLSIPDGSIKLADPDGPISRLLNAGADPTGISCGYTWAMPDVDPVDWFVLMQGLLADWAATDGGYSQTLNLKANDQPLQGDADRVQFLEAEFPKAPPETWQTFFPIVYGSHSAVDLHGKGMVRCIPWSIDAGEGYRYTPTLGHAKSVPRVYKNGVLLTLSVDYDLSYPDRGKLFTSIDLAAATTADDIITCDIDGLEDVGDGTGELITNLIDVYRHWLANFAFGSWRHGAWFDPADYPIDLDSFARAASFATAFLPPCSARFGGAAQAETIPAAMQRFLGTGLCFRPYWTETSKFALATISHLFDGFTSPGFASDAAAVFIRGQVQEIGVSFAPAGDVGNLLSRVNLAALPGLDADGRSEKFFQSIPVQDVSQVVAAAESYELSLSSAVLS